MKPLFEMPELLTLDGLDFGLNNSFAVGPNTCGHGCKSGCHSGCTVGDKCADPE